MKITITEKERKSTVNLIMVDPCTEIECGAIDCNHCPFQTVGAELRQAQENFIKVLNSLDILG